LRLPSLADPKYYLDEGVYSSVAYELGQGGTLYKTAWDLKPPGIFYVYLFFQKVFGPHAFLAQRVFSTLLTALAVFGAFELAIILGLQELSSCVALLTALCIGLPFFETQVFNTENIFGVTSLFAFIYGLKFKEHLREPFLAGLLFGVGQWFKIHPIFDLAAFGIFALYKFRSDKKFWLPFMAGLATPLMGLLFCLLANGIVADFIETNLSYNLFYVEELPQITIFGNLLVRTLLLVVATAVLVFLKLKNKISENTLLLSLWLIFVFYGALLSARAYGHYFIPTLIPAALLVSFLTSNQNRIFRQAIAYRNIRISLRVLLLALSPFAAFIALQTTIRTKSLYQKIFSDQIHFYEVRLDYLLGKTGQRDFEKNFTPKPWRLRELKNYLDENVGANEQIFLWGNSPWASYVLQRRPAQRFLMWFHVLGIKEREEEVYQDLLSKPPEVIVVEDEWPEGESDQISRPPFPKLQQLIDTNYKFQTKIAGYNVYRRAIWAFSSNTSALCSAE